ncbi:hypothetical protein [uncultured Sulfitobacter sp.]|tara:strand:+ start:488 stop:625 length:138 start_codon:yes stop_codon:yes gene_type:complete
MDRRRSMTKLAPVTQLRMPPLSQFTDGADDSTNRALNLIQKGARG